MKKLIHMLSKGLHFVAQLILLAMMLVITFDVLARWLFDFPITGTYDFTQSGLSMVIFLGLSYTHYMKEHISIDFLIEKFSDKGQFIFNGAINLFIAVIMSLVTVKLIDNSQRLASSSTVTGDLNWPISVFAILAALGTAAFALIAAMSAVVYLQKVVTKNES